MKANHTRSGMHEFDSLDIRPYQLLCLFCRLGRAETSDTYYHEERLTEIGEAVLADPILPLTLRCNTDTVFRYQSPGRLYDTPEGEMFNDLRDLTVLQRLGAVPGHTLPAIDFISRIPDAIPTCRGVCSYEEAEAPGWGRCEFAASGNYERGVAKGRGALLQLRESEEMKRVKRESASACAAAGTLRIRPHHLLCMTCFHCGRSTEELEPIEADNLHECIEVMHRNPGIPVELVHGPCDICPPCAAFHAATNLCIGGSSMGLRDDKKDLDTLRLLGMRYGDILPASELLRRLYAAISDTTQVCGFGDGVVRSPEWRVCGGPTGYDGFKRAREMGLGVAGALARDASDLNNKA